MSRRTDYAIGLGLLGGPVSLFLLGLAYTPLHVVGAIGFLLVAPVSYKLVRYPSTRRNSLGEVVAAARKEAGAGPVGTGGALICFSGIDGSGKTTQAEAIVEELEQSGVESTHVWARWRPFLSYPFMGVLFVTRGWRRKDYRKSDLVKRVWGYFLIADHLLFFLRFIYPHLRRGRVVCVDRYILDQLVEMRYDGLYRERFDDLLRRWLPTPDATFLMDVPADVANDRKRDTGEMLDRLEVDADPLEYLRERRAYFREFATLEDAVMDTTRPMSETHGEVTELVWGAYLEF